ncbi:hypothetical protein [endosymbiont of unidentified scaly snail isolate Monju]|uniref:hypothetical protein n=1 Tax=endosymbiont of unidentified scaly snail isolate Monju TaxID=1248727 RepID=UPI0005BD0264|nr:hypothetical protein [endosymbiont of unidentified scaly snail isolate Monju]
MEQGDRDIPEAGSEIVIGYRHGRLYASEYLVLCSKVVGGTGLDVPSMQRDDSGQAASLADVVIHSGEEETVLVVAVPPQAKLAPDQLLTGASPIDPQKRQSAAESVSKAWKSPELAIVAGTALVTCVLLIVIAWVWFPGEAVQEVVTDEPPGHFRGLYPEEQGKDRPIPRKVARIP